MTPLAPSRILTSILLALFVALPCAASEPPKPDRLAIIGGSTGGSWYAYATGLVPIFKKHGIDVTVEPGGGSVNPLKISNGEADAAFGQTSANFDAKTGAGAFEKYGKIGGILNLAMVSTDHVHLVCSKDSGVTTWEGLKGVRFGAPGATTSSWGNFLAGLQVAGLNEGDLDIVSRGGANDGAKMVKDRQADCVTHTSHYPVASFSELALGRPVTFIGMSDAQIAEVSKLNEGLIPGVIPAGAYAGQDQEVKVFKAGSVIMTHEELSDAKAYWIVKIIGENLEQVRQIHKGISNLDLETMKAPPVFGLHPGARRYYEEKGLL